jgi:hypothetical protein
MMQESAPLTMQVHKSWHQSHLTTVLFWLWIGTNVTRLGFVADIVFLIVVIIVHFFGLLQNYYQVIPRITY